MYTEDHLIEQPAIQFIRNELGWEVVNCYDEWCGGVSNQGRDGKREGVKILNFECLILNGRGRRPALQRLNPDLPVEAVEGAVEENGILNDGFWILNGRGRRPTAPRLNPSHLALSLAEANREIDKRHRPGSEVLFAPEPDRQCNRLVINEFLFELKTSIAVSPLGETQLLSEIPVHKLNIITNRSTGTTAR